MSCLLPQFQSDSSVRAESVEFSLPTISANEPLNALHLEDDLNYLRSVLKSLHGGSTWYTIPVGQDTASIRTDLSTIVGSTIVAGTGLTGGGALSSGTITLNVDSTEVVMTTGTQTIAGTKTFSSTVTGSISGNAGTATRLATARTINGIAFDGTANITLSTSTANSLTAGNGLTGTAFDGSVASTFALGTPGTLTSSTTNSVTTTSHTHVLSGVVFTSTNQSIAGIKTFSGSLVIPNK